MNQAMQQVINLYPDREKRIRQMWQADEAFQELCQDYALCLETISRWSAAPTPPADEYQSLRRRLEFEIEMKTEKRRKENTHEE